MDFCSATSRSLPSWSIAAGTSFLPNRPARAIMSDGVSKELLTPPVNSLRVTLHPDGIAPRIVNFAEYSAHLLEQLHRQAVLSSDPDLFDLEKELRAYPGVSDAQAGSRNPSSALFVPLVLRVAGGLELTFFNTLTAFGTALDITLAELTIEALYPADRATTEAVRAVWGSAARVASAPPTPQPRR
jgi:hypothetical protein